MVTCERCGRESPDGFRFCGVCGAQLPHGAGLRETRKVVTVIFCDVTGWTALSEGLDPEALRAVISRYFKEIRETIERHGGTVEKFIGDAVMAVFGIPRVHEDDALRAVRAAAEIRKGLPAVANELGVNLRFRTGVNTGPVFTGEGESLVVGDAVNVAARLEQAAKPGEILLGIETTRLVLDAVEVEPLSPLEVKGKSVPVSAFRLVALKDESRLVSAVRDRSDVAPPMVGRDDELAALRTAFVRAAESGEMQLVTVVGEAGIGKSRLAQELIEQLGDGATVLVGRCLSYGEGIAFWPLREALTEAARGQSRDAIRQLLGDVIDADVVADIIAGTLGLAAAESLGEQVPWAFRRLLEVLSARSPVLLVIEDAHWAESMLLDLVDYLVDWLTSPVMVLCLGRPEVLDLRPRWGGGHLRVKSVLLAPLGDADARALLGRRLGDRNLSDFERAQILETAEGNPLFVEQILAMSAEDPSVGREGEIPMTIQSLLSARLDRLSRGERAFIERAALIGREFPSAAVIELLPGTERTSAAQNLNALIRRGLLHPDRSSSMGGEEQLRFHHILIRDVAYNSMPKTLRSELHRRFADWLVPSGEQFDEFTGYHLGQAYRYRRELGRLDPETLTLADRAGGHLAAAGRRALLRGQVHSAAQLLRTSADLFERGGRVRPDILLDLGAAVSESGDFTGAERILQRVREHAVATREEAVGARASIELAYQRLLVDPSARIDEMLALTEASKAVFEREGDESGVSRAWQLIGEVHWTRCRCADMEKALEQALPHAERAGRRQERARILTDLASATVVGPGSVADGIQRCHEILERADGDARLIGVTGTLLALLDAMEGRFDQAREAMQQSRSRLESLGLTVTAGMLSMYLGFLELMAGTPERAHPELAAACAMLEQIGERHRLATIAAVYASVLYAEGRYQDSRRYTEISEDSASKDDVGAQVIWRGTRGKALARLGETELARSLADSVVELTEETDFLMVHADGLCDRAEVLSLLGHPDEAAADLSRAIELYERKGALISAQTARATYRSLSAEPAA